MYTLIMFLLVAIVASLLSFYAGVLTGEAKAANEIRRQQKRVRTMLDSIDETPSALRSAPVRRTSSPTHTPADRSNHPNWWNL
jgi:hypothetical protein